MITFLQQRSKSFGYALRGIYIFFRDETHAKIHLFATVIVTIFGFWLKIATWEWCVILLCFGAVLTAEAINSALERLTDLASPDYHPLAEKTKDLAAGAVLLMSIFVAIIGLIIFLPKLVLLWHAIKQ